MQLLDRFTLAGDFRVTDLTGQTACYSIQGSESATIMRQVLAVDSAIDRSAVTTARF